MASTPALVSALRELGDRPAVVADGRAISGIGLLLGVSPPGGLPRALAERVAEHAALPPSTARAAEERLRHWAGVLGPPPIRHTVLHPATDLAVELALATLLAGGTVHCADPDQRPDEQLTALAANGTTHLSLPSALLWRLSRQPDLADHDLGALRLVLHVGPEPRQDDVYAAVDALGAVLAHLRAPDNRPEAADRRLRADTEAATAAAWKHSIGVTAEQLTEFGAHLDRAVLTALLHTLQQAGVLTDPEHGRSEAELLATALVTPAQRPRVGRWLDALARHGLIAHRDGGAQGPIYHGAHTVSSAEVREAWRSAVDSWTDGLGTAAVLDRVRRGALRLPKLLTGEEAPRPAAAPVRWAAARGYLGTALGALVRATVEAHQGPQPPRVLELDRDGTETAVARALAARPRQHAEHHLATDGGRYDVVVATAGGRPEEEVPALVDLLAPGGRLLLLAPVTEQLDLLITGDPRGLTAHPARHWRTALTTAGCPTVLTLPADGHPMGLLGQGLFVARVD
ncbi:hypothetical protein [Streptomyces sp. CBMA123]|uniref:hypothetical protein n=1 Tax=Streptomyces sp. CBMA123 TaxID=1896313 RepID=UPI001661996D|nr:hypothetical protein [Streptomyces sp. CBMA123]MBD0695523.1 hypothetical protein [Streptomyces sp. CBMA123]